MQQNLGGGVGMGAAERLLKSDRATGEPDPRPIFGAGKDQTVEPAVGETLCCTPLSLLAGASTGMERGRQQNDSLTNG